MGLRLLTVVAVITFLVQLYLGLTEGAAFIKSKKSLGKIHFGNDVKNRLFIVNGKLATAGQFPYQLFLEILVGSDHSFCGGSLLTPKYALTAAHCVIGCDRVKLRFGLLELRNYTYPEGQETIQVGKEDILIHPDYTTTNHYNDIAIISLGTDVYLSDTIGVVKLPTSPSGLLQNVTVSGWGKTWGGSSMLNPNLSYIQVPYLDNTTCAEWCDYNSDYTLGTKQMCTASLYEQSTCQGDSGGPVTVLNDDGTFTQVGIVSLGFNLCETEGAPNIHTDIYSYKVFIEDNTDYK